MRLSFLPFWFMRICEKQELSRFEFSAINILARLLLRRRRNASITFVSVFSAVIRRTFLRVRDLPAEEAYIT